MRFFGGLRKHFFTGLALLLPIVFTLLVLQYTLKLTDDWLVDPFYQALPFELDKTTAVILIKGLILVILFTIICLIGFATEIFVFRSMINIGENVLNRVPMVNRIYATFKDVMSTVMGGKRELFRSAVLIPFPRPGVYAVAFVTRSNHPELEDEIGKDMVSVFMPTTPNPTSGMLMFFSKKEIIPLPVTIEEAVRIVISGGAMTGKIASYAKKMQTSSQPTQEK